MLYFTLMKDSFSLCEKDLLFAQGHFAGHAGFLSVIIPVHETRCHKTGRYFPKILFYKRQTTFMASRGADPPDPGVTGHVSGVKLMIRSKQACYS